MDLPPDLLRTFVTVAELGSVTRAAERVGRTQPAVTLQLRRLEALLGRTLFVRQGRRLSLAPQGEVLLRHARAVLAANDAAVAALLAEPLSGPLRVGLVQDFADTLLPGVLARFAARHDGVRLEVTVANSAALRAGLANGALEIVMCAARPGEVPALATPLRWFGAADLAARDPLPLALLEPPCGYRDAALAALEQAGRRWRVVVTSPSLSGVRAAVAAGLGLTVRSRLLGGLPTIDDGSLPALKPIGHTVLVAEDAGPAPQTLAGMLRTAMVGL
jgi:DNA-binding transcriptional LysR family regulator